MEVRISQFRACLVVFLLIFSAQYLFWTKAKLPSAFVPLTLATGALALAFSVFVVINQRRKVPVKITLLAIISIGIDATLVVLPVSLFFSVSENPHLSEHHPAILNQPSVFAMYLLVVASGLRFRETARLGIAVNGLLVLCLMLIEKIRVQTPEGLDPIAALAIRQHFLLLISSALLAWLISTHIRTTTLKAAETALQATVDGLTGVYNRHHLRDQLEVLCTQKETSLHLLMTDVDHFKSINDELGHLMGDRVLVEIARRLQTTLRPGDLLARYGGEEFCVVLSNLDDRLAQSVGERLRQEIHKQPIEGRKVTVSVGLSRWDGAEPLSQLIDRADRALYQAKEAGRNQVIAMWPSPEV